jgi:hypothetical protein
MPREEWILLFHAAALLRIAGVAKQRLFRALMLGKAEARGEKEGKIVLVPAEEFCGFLDADFDRARLFPVGNPEKTAYSAVEVRRADVERLAREFGQALAEGTTDLANISPAEIGRVGGKKSGERRRAGRQWVPHATELAEAASSRDPAASNERIAGAIADNWKLREVECPGHRTLSAFVSKLRASGKLPQRSGSLPKQSG